jgi:hypothetical protein
MPFPNLRRAVVAMLAATLLIALSAASAGATIEPAPGGPILVVTNSADPHSTYYTEILRAEGLDEFATVDISQVNAATLAGYDAVVLASAGVNAAQVQALTAWVQAGGNLVAMRPDAALAPLLGLTYIGGSDTDGYLTIDTSRPPGAGIVGSAIQYHGTADRYAPAGARAVAMLASGTPAVTQRDLGAGHAAAFTYDLARSVIGTRQGNQAWAGQDHDGDGLTRPTDMFMSATPGVGDWLNRAEIQIPQADEQQRLLANLLTTATRTPLPRFWYLPRGDKAEVVLTGDDHGSGTTGNIWEELLAKDPPGCSVADWQCVRATSYAYPGSPVPTNTHSVADFQSLGFELALHLTISNSSCTDFSGLTQLNSLMTQQLNAFATTQGTAGAAPSTTTRTHCIAWSDWDSQPLADLAHGIRLNTDYYWYSANNWD